MKIVFTDLDGTLLDHDTYSTKPAEKGISYLKENNIPLIFCTSKTRSEIDYWRSQLGNVHPFISENGGGIFIPKGYFTFTIDSTEELDNYQVIQLGTSLKKLKRVMKELEEMYDITSFLQISVEQLVRETNLTAKQAGLSLQRDFDIPFLINNHNQVDDIINVIKKKNLQVTKGGRFYHLIGENDKGKAVQILSNLYSREYECIETIGIGDSENDFPMLEAVDYAFLVRKKDGSFASHRFSQIDGIGPKGWQQIISQEFIL